MFNLRSISVDPDLTFKNPIQSFKHESKISLCDYCEKHATKASGDVIETKHTYTRKLNFACYASTRKKHAHQLNAVKDTRYSEHWLVHVMVQNSLNF